MLKTIQIIKEQIKALKNDQKAKESLEIQELKDLLEFINTDHQILESENQELQEKIKGSTSNIRLKALTDALAQEKAKNLKLKKKLEAYEEMMLSQDEPGNSTTRANINGFKLNNTVCSDKSPVKSFQSLPKKSPIKPPRSVNRTSKQTIVNKATLQIKSNLAMAIDQAHKTLVTSKTGLNRSASPCFSTSSSRYSTPSRNKAAFNTSLE